MQPENITVPNLKFAVAFGYPSSRTTKFKPIKNQSKWAIMLK